MKLNRIGLLFAALAIALLVSIFAAFWTGRLAIEGLSQVDRHQDGLNLLQEVLLAVEDAETSQRGYLITGDESYIALYEAAAHKSRIAVGKLLAGQHLPEIPYGDIALVEQLADKKLKELDQTAELRRRGELDAAIRIVKAGSGKQYMESLRKQIGKLTAIKGVDHLVTREMVRQVSLTRTVAFALSAALCLLFTVWSYSRMREEISSRECAATEAQRQKDILGTTLASIGDGVIVIDSAARITFLNDTACFLTGWSREEAINQPCNTVLNIIDGNTRQQPESSIEKALRKGIVAGPTDNGVIIRRDGREVPVHESAAPIRETGDSIRGAVLVIRDFTEQRRTEKILREADRQKNEFLAVLGHELRNPLAAMHIAVEVWKRPGSDEMLPQIKSTFENQTAQLRRLVDDLLEVSRITNGKINLQMEQVLLFDIVERSLVSTRDLMDSKGHSVSTDVPDRPIYVYADPARLEQVLVNLLTNAGKYTQERGRIKVTIEPRGTRVYIKVKDNGPGIPQEWQSRIFEIFGQMENSLHRAKGGLGIGLHLVQKLVKMHDGTVSVYSQGPGTGSEFTVCLPVLLKPEQKLNNGAQFSAERGRSLSLLLVEDNQDAARMMCRVLEMEGHRVQVAHDGQKAVEKASTDRPEVLLCDLGLPGIDGRQVAYELRNKAGCRDTLMVALSGYGQQKDIQAALAAGFDAHLVKPIDLKELKRIIQNWSGDGSGGNGSRV